MDVISILTALSTWVKDYFGLIYNFKPGGCLAGCPSFQTSDHTTPRYFVNTYSKTGIQPEFEIF